MAIEFDALGGPTSATSTGLTWSHTVGSGLNRLLIVVTSVSGVGVDITGVTYNSVAMTMALDTGNNPSYRIWYLANPDSGAHDVAASSNGDGSETIRGASTSYAGINQSEPVETAGATGAVGGSPLTINITTVRDGCWLVSGGKTDDAVTVSAGAGTVVRGTDSTARFHIGDSDSITSPAGADSLIYSFAGGNNLTMVGIAIKPFGSFSPKVIMI